MLKKAKLLLLDTFLILIWWRTSAYMLTEPRRLPLTHEERNAKRTSPIRALYVR
jgi:hypothetical protein